MRLQLSALLVLSLSCYTSEAFFLALGSEESPDLKDTSGPGDVPGPNYAKSTKVVGECTLEYIFNGGMSFV